MEYIELALLGLLILCAIMTVVTKNLLSSVVIYMAFGTIMSILWVVLEAPDLAITEAAVGVGVSGVLFFLTLKKIHKVRGEHHEKEE